MGQKTKIKDFFATKEYLKRMLDIDGICVGHV